ncbi:MAG: FtsX-like permease family protein [Planctomycetes bacterium]|nr:FtsX-like permease family protein [Planctomycetota bacterium]
MKYLPYLLRHLRHNWVRTSSTVLGMAFCIFLFCTLSTLIAAVDWSLKSAKASILVTRHAVSLVFTLPIAYRERIAAVPGARAVSPSNWFGGVYKDMKNFFPSFAVDAETYLRMHPEFILKDPVKEAFLRETRGCVIGKDVADRFGWKTGDLFQMESFIPPYRKTNREPFEFMVCGVYDTDEIRYPGSFAGLMLFHFKYLYEGTSQRCGIATYHVEIEDPEKAGVVSKTIDDLFENSDTPTKTETESAFRAGFISLGGNLALLLWFISLAVIFSILLVTANTMIMAIRERKVEIGVLKTLGFTNLKVLSLVLAEAAFLGVLGGALGIFLSSGMIRALPKIPFLSDAVRGFPFLHLSWEGAGQGFGLAVLIGIAAGLVPALISFRARITALLRQV